jgi:pimeloyl-ACP methyl ester carboxylesterase
VPVTPTLLPVSTSTIKIGAADGNQITATEYGQSQQVVIFSNMETNSPAAWSRVATGAARLGYMSVTYKYSREGKERTNDLIDVIKFVQAQGAREIILVGASRGGIVSLQASVNAEINTPIVALVVFSAPIQYEGVTYYTSQELESITIPKLLLSAEYDVYINQTREIFETFSEPKELQLFPGEAHGTDLFKEHSAELVQLLMDFIASHFSQ